MWLASQTSICLKDCSTASYSKKSEKCSHRKQMKHFKDTQNISHKVFSINPDTWKQTLRTGLNGTPPFTKAPQHAGPTGRPQQSNEGRPGEPEPATLYHRARHSCHPLSVLPENPPRKDWPHQPYVHQQTDPAPTILRWLKSSSSPPDRWINPCQL